MKLILHIGTPKTGSTALQRYFNVNHESLKRVGIHYVSPDPPKTVNAIVDAVCDCPDTVVRGFFNSNVEVALRKGAHTMIVSAENFYGMTVVESLRRRRPWAEGHDRESVLVHRLRRLVPDTIADHQVVCYVRRPDRFAESWYNQHVKGSSLFTGTFEDFLRIVSPILSYGSYLGIWADAFGQKKCTVRVYETVGNVVTDFVRNVLQVDDSRFSRQPHFPNERMSRELLEFKRMRNATLTQRDKDIEYRALPLLERRLTLAEISSYQEFLSPHQRAELLDGLACELETLQSSFGLPPFPRFDLEAAKASWKSYPGLELGRQQELERQYSRITRLLRFRLGRLYLRLGGEPYAASALGGALLDATRQSKCE